MTMFRDEVPTLGNATVDLPEMFPAGVTPPKVPAYVPVNVALSATSTSQTVFTAPASAGLNGQYKFIWATVRFGTQSTSGTLQIEKAASGTAVGGGTNLLQGTMALSGTANTPTHSSGAAAPVTNPNTVTLSAGDSLNFIIAGTMTGLANCLVTIWLARV